MSLASKLVASAIICSDTKSVVVNGKIYPVPPPTIRRLAGSGKYLSDFGDESTISDILRSVNSSENLCKALSWLICGSEDLYGELSEGTFEEIAAALEVAYSMISVRNFMRLSALAKSVAELIAKSN